MIYNSWSMKKNVLLLVLFLSFLLQSFLTLIAFFNPAATLRIFKMAYNSNTAMLGYFSAWSLLLITMAIVYLMWMVKTNRPGASGYIISWAVSILSVCLFACQAEGLFSLYFADLSVLVRNGRAFYYEGHFVSLFSLKSVSACGPSFCKMYTCIHCGIFSLLQYIAELNTCTYGIIRIIMGVVFILLNDWILI